MWEAVHEDGGGVLVGGGDPGGVDLEGGGGAVAEAAGDGRQVCGGVDASQW